MSNRERYHESMRRTTSRHDQGLQRKAVEHQTTADEGRENYQELCHELDAVMQRYFPDELTRFTPPSLDRTQGNLAYIAGMFGKEMRESHTFDRSFIAGAAVRYVDNFIDEALWPKLKERLAKGKTMQGVEERFSTFLDDVYAVVIKHEAYLPEEILNLPRTEMRLLLHGDQQTFDDNIGQYFFYKSFNLAYMEHLFTQQKSAESVMWTDKERSQFHLIAAWDVARDIHSWGNKQDFDIFAHIHEHQLDPNKMIKLLWQIMQSNGPKTYEYAHQQEAGDHLCDYEQLTDLIAEDGLQGLEAQGLMNCYIMIDYLKHIHEADEVDETPEQSPSNHLIGANENDQVRW